MVNSDPVSENDTLTTADEVRRLESIDRQRSRHTIEPQIWNSFDDYSWHELSRTPWQTVRL